LFKIKSTKAFRELTRFFKCFFCRILWLIV